MTDKEYPEQSQASTALAVGILGVFLCWFLAPFAWRIGAKELNAIAGGRRPKENRGSALGGVMLGMAGTVLLVVGTAAVIYLSQVGDFNDWVSCMEEGGRTCASVPCFLGGTCPGDSVTPVSRVDRTVSIFDLEVGDCGLWGNGPQAVTKVGCLIAHDFEIYAFRTFEAGPGVEYPLDVEAVADQECSDAFAEFPRVPNRTFNAIYPTADSWSQGERTIVCAVTVLVGPALYDCFVNPCD